MLMDAAEAASFFPTASEVVRAVQFARENPAVVLGVVVGLTSLSVAKYYEEGSEEDIAVLAAAENERAPATQQDSRSDTPSGKRERRGSSMAHTDSTETIGCNLSSLRLSPSPEVSEVTTKCDQLHRNCSFCNQIAESPDSCCDPDWGWFIPTSPEDEHDGHHHHVAAASPK